MTKERLICSHLPAKWLSAVCITALPLLLADTASAERTSMETVSAEWSNGTLYVAGTSGDDSISIASKGDLIEVNGGLIPVVGGTPTASNTSLISVLGLSGNDSIVFSQWGSSLPDADLDGGEGNDLLISGDGVDVLRGGAGNDVLIGGRGNDVVLGQDGSDQLIWNDGDGSDFMEGGAGFDFVQVNGSNGAGDFFQIDPNDQRVGVYRDSDGTGIDLSAENLTVYGHGGDDVITGSVGLAGLTSLELDGGIGSDVLTGGDGNDRLDGGSGNDVLLGEEGRDIIVANDGNDLLIWNDGDGSDFMEGGAGFDFVQVNGSNTAGDDFSIDPNGERVRFQRNNLGLFTLDIGTTENLDVNGQGGSDVIVGSVGLNGLIGLDLDGGEGNDLLIGGDGPDVLDGGRGTDTCDGNGGRDRLMSCESKLDRS